MPTTSLYPRQARGKRVHWLLTMEWAGRTIRAAQEELDVETEDGEVLHFADALGDIDFGQRLEFGGSASGMVEQPVEMLLPADVSVVALTAAGHDLASARVELARWVEGTTWESRCVRATGRAVDAEHGEDDEPIAFTVSDSLADDDALTGSPATTVIGANWAHADEVPSEFLGEQYPIVFGHPGVVSTYVDPSGRVTGSWAHWVDYRRSSPDTPQLAEIRAVIAGHHVQAETVYVCTDEAPGLTYRVRVENGFDDRGHPVAWLPWFFDSSPSGAPAGDHDGGTYTYNYSGTDSFGTVYGLGHNSLPGSFNGAEAQRLYISWRDEVTPAAGGLEHGGKLIREAGDVIGFLLEQAGRAVDHGRMKAASAALSRFKLDGVIADRVSLWGVLVDDILPALPVALADGPEGKYLIVGRTSAGPGDASFRIDADRTDIDRLSNVRSSDTNRINRVIVKYAYRFRTKQYAGEITIGTQADVDDASNPDLAQVSAACERARAQMGGRVVEKVIQAPYVYDDASARAIAESQVALFAGRQRTVEYLLPESEFIQLRLGAVGVLQHEALGFDEQEVRVEALQVRPDGLRVELKILDQ